MFHSIHCLCPTEAMYSTEFSMKITVAAFIGFVFHVACHDSRRACFDVDSKTICYFMPNVSSVNWDTAWKTCRELDATLPVILNEKGQEALENYLTEHFPVQSVWAAGRYIGNHEWRWLNNQIVRRTDKPTCNQHDDGCLYETQAVLTKNLEYKAIFPDNDYNYICSFPAVNCENESPKSISWKGGCLIWTTNHRLPVNKARNECLKGGGDLATFSEDGDLQHLRQFSSVVEDADEKGYLIGLHRKWWIWNTTYVLDMKFNLLNDYGDTGEDCLFLDSLSKWSRDTCSVNKTVICQIAFVAIGIVGVVLAAAVTAVVLLIFIKKRRSLEETNLYAPTTKADPVTASPQNTFVQSSDNIYSTFDFDDDFENLNSGIDPNPSALYTELELFCNNRSAVYLEPAEFIVSETNRSTALYSEPHSSLAARPVPQDSTEPSSATYTALIK